MHVCLIVWCCIHQIYSVAGPNLFLTAPKQNKEQRNVKIHWRLPLSRKKNMAWLPTIVPAPSPIAKINWHEFQTLCCQSRKLRETANLFWNPKVDQKINRRIPYNKVNTTVSPLYWQQLICMSWYEELFGPALSSILHSSKSRPEKNWNLRILDTEEHFTK